MLEHMLLARMFYAHNEAAMLAAYAPMLFLLKCARAYAPRTCAFSYAQKRLIMLETMRASCA